jgi:ionotropic kainate glutamate receptor 3/ionotropic kainate glutamate receptor 5
MAQLILEEFNKIEAWSLLSFDARNDCKEMLPSSSKYEAYVLLSSRQDHEDVVKDIGHQVKKLRNTWKWNPRAKFVILVMEIHVHAKLLAEDISAELWTSRVVNSVVLIPALDTHMATGTVNILDAYLCFPYQPTVQCPQVKDAVLQDRWILDSRNRSHFLHNTSLFPQKIPNGLHGCPLTVSTFELPPMIMRKNTTEVDPKNIVYDKGLEIQILTELAKSTNSSLKFRETPPGHEHFGVDLGNGTWNGVTGEIARSSADIGMGGTWYRCHLVKEIECRRPYLIDKVKWYVSCARLYPRWMSLTRVFKLSLWLGFVAGYVTIAFIMWQVVKITSNISTEAAQNQAYASLAKCLLNFWAIILEESASNNPPDVAVVRAVFLAWVLYCWAINTVYQAYLTNFLIDPGLQHQLTSEDEILNSGIEYGAPANASSLQHELSGERYRHLKHTDNVESIGDRVVNGTLAFLCSMFVTEYMIAVKYMDADGRPRMCDIKDDFAAGIVTMFVPKGFPFKARYDKVLSSLVQSGLVNFWWENLKYVTTLEKAGDFNPPPGEYVALTMKHLQSAFYFLLLGYAISIMSFLLELSCQCRKRYEIKRIRGNRN